MHHAATVGPVSTWMGFWRKKSEKKSLFPGLNSGVQLSVTHLSVTQMVGSYVRGFICPLLNCPLLICPLLICPGTSLKLNFMSPISAIVYTQSVTSNKSNKTLQWGLTPLQLT